MRHVPQQRPSCPSEAQKPPVRRHAVQVVVSAVCLVAWTACGAPPASTPQEPTPDAAQLQDAGPSSRDASSPPDAAHAQDAATPRDAAVPPDAAPAADAAVTPDAALPPDAAANVPDAAAAPDAGADAGTCSPASCDDSNPCTLDTCSQGTCTHDAAPSTTACDDNNACTLLDRCEAGTCKGQSPVDCGAPQTCQEPATCDPATGMCMSLHSLPGTPCNDGDLATSHDACDGNGACDGLEILCMANTACTTYAPDGVSTCVPTLLDNVPCDDGSACTSGDLCETGTCVGHNPVVCPAPGTCQEQGSCDVATGVCSRPIKVPGSPCDDGNASTWGEQCTAQGMCEGTPVVCDPDTACATHAPNGTATCDVTWLDGAQCDDQDACTGVGYCESGACHVPPAVTCTNGGTCNDGACACPSAWTGPTCAQDTNECDHNACGGGSDCTNTPGAYSCACISNYSSADGTNCVASVPALELVFFYDDAAARAFGPDPTVRLYSIFSRAKRLLEDGLTTAPFTLSLNAVMRMSPYPASVTLRACNTPDPARPACTGCWLNPPPPDCSNPYSVDAAETDPSALLASFGTYANNTRRAAINTAAGKFDVAVLFAGTDFAASIVELASSSTACAQFGGIVEEANAGRSDQFHAVVLAHAIGHNMGMFHDASGAPYIMAPSASETVTAFSSASLSSYAMWRARTGVAACIGDVARSNWRGVLCGNGVLDDGETCDPGVADDTCCNDSCQLEPGCQCSNVEPCCQAGQFRATGSVCGAARTDCDLPDTCDGHSGSCRDVYKAPGTTCANAGYCLNGACASRTLQCREPGGSYSATWTACETNTLCDRMVCNDGSGCGTFWSIPAEDGTSCGAGHQCVAGACQPTTSLRSYAWVVGAWSTCVDQVSTRSVDCVDETGMVVINAACSALPAPSASQACAP